MAVSIPDALANITVSSLNFTQNCSNVAIGYQVWQNDFSFSQPSPGNATVDDASVDDGPEGYYNFWTNGSSPEWLQFWRSALGTALDPVNYTDAQLAAWTNQTEFFNFFDNDFGWRQPNKLDSLANVLSAPPDRGCNATYRFDTGLRDYADFQMGCMLSFCCAPNKTTADESTSQPYPFFTNWTVADACAFDTCANANHGNPDLGGIGVVVAYILELMILIVFIVFFGVKLVTDWWYDRAGKSRGKRLLHHDAAIKAAAGVMIDTAVFFSFSINFAAIIFTTREEPQLYEDKLGQISTLLALDAPVAILLLSYTMIDRRIFRVSLVFLDALMTFIIQFIFRKVKSFDAGTTLCFDWDDLVEMWFRQRFYAKVVWAILIVFFALWYPIMRGVSRVAPRFRRRSKFGGNRLSKIWRRIAKSQFSAFLSWIYDYLNWRRTIAFLLACYGLFAIIIDLRFIIFLRHQEADIGTNVDEDRWGYGQLLAIFVWLPVLVEYLYLFVFRGRSRSGKAFTGLGRGETMKSEKYEMVQHIDEPLQVKLRGPPSLQRKTTEEEETEYIRSDEPPQRYDTDETVYEKSEAPAHQYHADDDVAYVKVNELRHEDSV